MAIKDEYQHHGILVFDSIRVGKKMHVHSKLMTYVGFSDFDDGVGNSDDLADHGHVFVFNAFGGQYSQPIAAFASKRPTIGRMLAQVVLKTVFMLEEAGVLVDAVVFGGAAANRYVWKEFGLSGSLNSTKIFFTHPANNKRRILVLKMLRVL